MFAGLQFACVPGARRDAVFFVFRGFVGGEDRTDGGEFQAALAEGAGQKLLV